MYTCEKEDTLNVVEEESPQHVTLDLLTEDPKRVQQQPSFHEERGY